VCQLSLRARACVCGGGVGVACCTCCSRTKAQPPARRSFIAPIDETLFLPSLLCASPSSAPANGRGTQHPQNPNLAGAMLGAKKTAADLREDSRMQSKLAQNEERMARLRNAKSRTIGVSDDASIAPRPPLLPSSLHIHIVFPRDICAAFYFPTSPA
jgi:hypothetical protein